MAAKRYSFVFYVAIVVAIGATYAVFKVLESTKASSRVATAPVVVASRDINEGEKIDRLALSVAQWPVSTVPVGAYGRIDSVAGRVARVPVFNGEPLVPGRLAPEGTDAGLLTKITPGKRAMSVRINDVTGIAGMIPPNSRVDIALTTTLANAQRTAKLFMSNMRVLAMQTAVHKSEDGRPIPATVATLEVTPEESELLLVAQSQGSIQLVLRGYGDPDSVVTRGATSADVERALRDGPGRTPPPPRRTASRATQPPRVVPETVLIREPVAAPRQQAAKPDTNRVEIFRGGQKSELKFQKDSVKRDTIVKN
ncbi:MAG TPA: Flp pilus assembly protein CpaB [Gemmatimonadaceae bacterium]